MVVFVSLLEERVELLISVFAKWMAKVFDIVLLNIIYVIALEFRGIAEKNKW